MANAMVAPMKTRPTLARVELANAPEAASMLRVVCSPLRSRKFPFGGWREGPLSCASNGISSSGHVGQVQAQFPHRLINAVDLFCDGSKARKHRSVALVRIAKGQPTCRNKEGVAEARKEVEGAQAEASAVGPDSGSSAGTLKLCSHCGHAKLLCDFKKVKNYELYRDECRACLAALRAEKSGVSRGDLAMSVEEAWEKARPCTRCGVLKELRDFVKDGRKPDEFSVHCRACKADYATKRPARSASNLPKRCTWCNEVKPPDGFALNKNNRSGRHSTCRSCLSNQYRLDYARGKEVGALVQRTTKRCRVCLVYKPPAEMRKKRALAIDGLDNICNACNNVEKKQRWRTRKEGRAPGATPAES